MALKFQLILKRWSGPAISTSSMPGSNSGMSAAGNDKDERRKHDMRMRIASQRAKEGIDKKHGLFIATCCGSPLFFPADLGWVRLRLW